MLLQKSLAYQLTNFSSLLTCASLPSSLTHLVPVGLEADMPSREKTSSLELTPNTTSFPDEIHLSFPGILTHCNKKERVILGINLNGLYGRFLWMIRYDAVTEETNRSSISVFVPISSCSVPDFVTFVDAPHSRWSDIHLRQSSRNFLPRGSDSSEDVASGVYSPNAVIVTDRNLFKCSSNLLPTASRCSFVDFASSIDTPNLRSTDRDVGQGTWIADPLAVFPD